ncbi:hypothetical protein Hypma_011191 [Hypsizygus marmoreus]|uniref:Uncharacterized protein n=1 Tax=Hypsizygus marmoreus TaxID=39966 RepID=A0A369JMJ5_HYPMA|nr:hypothetical protein Hypma_011191 [Hypsizygus marmoreus]
MNTDTVTWPKTASSENKLHNTFQIQFSLSEHDGTLKVMAHNLLGGEGPYHWIDAPMFMGRILEQMFWRQWIMGLLYQRGERGDRDVVLKLYLRYLEVVLDKLWIILRTKPSITEIPPHILQWMRIDSSVKRHSTWRIAEWEEWEGRKVKDVKVSVEDWLESLQDFPCQAIMQEYNWAWIDVPLAIMEVCLSKMEDWLKKEELPVKGKGKEVKRKDSVQEGRRKRKREGEGEGEGKDEEESRDGKRKLKKSQNHSS